MLVSKSMNMLCCPDQVAASLQGGSPIDRTPQQILGQRFTGDPCLHYKSARWRKAEIHHLREGIARLIFKTSTLFKELQKAVTSFRALLVWLHSVPEFNDHALWAHR